MWTQICLIMVVLKFLTLDWRNQAIEYIQEKVIWKTLTWNYFQLLGNSSQLSNSKPSRYCLGTFDLGLKRWFAKSTAGCINWQQTQTNGHDEGTAKYPNCSYSAEKFLMFFFAAIQKLNPISNQIWNNLKQLSQKTKRFKVFKKQYKNITKIEIQSNYSFPRVYQIIWNTRSYHIQVCRSAP